MIHKYSLNGYNIVLDINSGAVHVFDDCAFALLDFVKDPPDVICPGEALESLKGRFREEEILSSHEGILELYREGLLFSDDTYEANLNQITNIAPIKALCLHVSHDCNLRCKYCFASEGDFTTGRKLMSAQTGKAAIDYVIARSEKRKNIEIDYFGGEPLLNFEVIKEITEYAKEQGKRHGKHFRFTVTTNGVLLDEDKLSYINENMGNLVLSVDGRKEVNDKMRTFPGGRGSYDQIMPMFQKAAQSRNQDNYYVRGTFTRQNLDFSEDVAHFAGLGFKQISVEPVVEKEDTPWTLAQEDLPAIFAEYEKLAKDLIEAKKNGNGYNFFHFMIDLDQGPCVIKRLKGCGAGNEYVAVTPEGDVYPCHQFVGNTDFIMGNVHDNTLDLKMKEKFSKSCVYSKEECKSCWAKFYCSGGCSANNFKFSGSIDVPHKLSCELEKKRVECAIMIKAALSEPEKI